MTPTKYISRFPILCVLCVLLTLAAKTNAQTWTGLGADNNWMTAGNWTPATTPATNATLIFTGTTQLANNNNFPAGSTFNGITFNASAGAFTLSGNSITPGSGLTDSSAAVETVALNIVLGAAHSFNVGLAGGDLVISGVISGGNSISQTGPGTLNLTGVNTFTGGITAIAGTLTISGNGELNNGNYAGAIVNSGNFNYTGLNNQNLTGAISNGGTITLNTAASMNVTGAITGPGSLNINGTGPVTIATGSSSVGSLSLGSGASVALNVTSSPGQFTSTNLTFAGGDSLTFNFSQTPNSVTAPLQVNGNVTISGSLGISISAASAPISAGDYPLIKYTGSLAGSPQTTPVALPSGVGGTIFNNTANHSIDLLVPAGQGNQATWATGSGTWDTTTPNWYDGATQDFTNGEYALFQDNLSGASPITVTLNSTVNPAGTTFASSKNFTLTGNGGLGSGYLTQQGPGTLTVNATNMQYSGTTSVNEGTLVLDFNAFFANSGGTLSNNIINSGSSLAMGGGTLDINGSTELGNGSDITNVQDFASTTFTAGNSLITFTGGTNADLNVGALSDSVGATVVFSNVSTMVGGVVGGTQAPQNGIVTTGTLGGGGVGLLGGNGTTTGDYATVGLYDWASTSGPNNSIVGGSEVSGFYTAFAPGNNTLAGNVDLTGATEGSHNTDSMGSIRFNVAGGCTWNLGSVCTTGGVLVTPNVGAANVFIGGTAGDLEPSRGGASATVFWQNNTQGWLVANANNFFNDAKSGAGTLILAGPGTMRFNFPSTYTGPTYINGSAVAFMVGNDLGAPATAAVAHLNGGAIVGSATFALDNAGANPRPISLGVNGGGLGALSNTVLTVDGPITSVVGAAPLYIGLPPSSANGNVLGLIPGTGPGAANPASNAIGVVTLTGTNTYTGGTILYSGTLLFNSNSLGTGGVTFNGGALQWAAGTTLDISAQTVTVASNGGTINLNGQSLTFANAIGNSGSGALTLTNGTLTLMGSNNYSGGTTIGSGATLIAANTAGSATGSGPVAVQSGAALEGPGTMSGAVTVLSGGVFNPTVSGVGNVTVGGLTLASGSTYNFQFNGSTNSQIVVANSGGLVLNGGAFNLTGLPSAGTYKLIQYSGSLGGSGLDSSWTTSSDANPHVINPNQSYLYSFGTSGGYLTVTATPNLSAVISTWTNNVNSVWSAAANWSPNRAPHAPGDAATFGVSTSLRTVTLDANETVGALAFTNINSFVITGGGTALTIDNSGSAASINVTGGAANAIQTAVSLNSTANVIVATNDSLSISGSISNEATPQTLAVSGSGTLALSGNNSYGPAQGSFGTTLTGGATLQLGNNNALGASDLAINGNSTVQAGASVTLTNNVDVAPGVNATVDSQANSLTLNGALTDSGNLTKIGSGTLTLGGNSVNYTGTATVKAGTLSISADSNLGADSTLVLNGGGLAGNGAVSLNRNINVGPALGSAGTNAYLDATGSGSVLQINGAIASAGNTGVNNLTINGQGGSGTVELLRTNPFSGTTIVAGGVLDLANAGALEDSTLNYNNQGGVLTFDSSISAATLGGLLGSQSLALTNTGGGPVALTVGANNSGGVYSGSLNDYGTGATLTKTGTGTLTLTGADSYTGITAVNGGKLEIPAGGILSVGVLNGGGYLIDGGVLSNGPTTVSSLAQINNTLLETAGTITVGEITQANNDAFQIQVNGGVFSAANVALGRSFNYGTTAPTAAAPIAAQTADGFYINSTNLLQPAQVYLGQLTIGITAANSSTSLRLDAGSVTVTNEVLIGDTSNTRYDVMQINGGNFTNLDTVNGITMSINDGATANNSELYLSGGNTYANILNFGAMNDTLGGSAYVFVDGGNLWMGSGGIDQSNSAGMDPVIYLESGILGATANWSSSIAGDGSTWGFLLPVAGVNGTIQAGDPNNVPHNISLSGDVGGPGNLVKTGGGVLALSGANVWTGNTTVSAGTLALAGDGTNTGVLSQTASINIVAPASVSVAGLTNDTLQLGDTTINEPVQSLTGNGAVVGNVTIGTQGTLAPGTATTFATFPITGNLTNAGALILKVGHLSGGATNDAISAQAITNLPGSTLTVMQGTNDLVTGDTFKLLNIVGNDGDSSATNLVLTLPVTAPVSAVTYVWNTNNLAVNGTITLTTGASSTPTTPTNMNYSVSGGVLNISWPSSYLGWSLQSNSVSLAQTNDWFTISGSSAVTNESITLPKTGSVFFRMSEH